MKSTRHSIWIVLLGILMSHTSLCQGQEQVAEITTWLTDFDLASQEAQNANLPILMSFSGSDWCIPCMRLDRDLFNTDEFRAFSAENLILLKVDFPSRKRNDLSEEQRSHNEALAERYNKSGAFPLVVVTDANGDVRGYMEHPLTSAKAYLASLSLLIDQ